MSLFNDRTLLYSVNTFLGLLFCGLVAVTVPLVSQYVSDMSTSAENKNKLQESENRNANRNLELAVTKFKFVILGDKMTNINADILLKQKELNELLSQINQARKEGKDISFLLQQYTEKEKELKEQIALREVQNKNFTGDEDQNSDKNIDTLIQQAKSKLQSEKNRSMKPDC